MATQSSASISSWEISSFPSLSQAQKMKPVTALTLSKIEKHWNYLKEIFFQILVAFLENRNFIAQMAKIDSFLIGQVLQNQIREENTKVEPAIF